MSAKDDALLEIATIAQRHNITIADITRALTDTSSKSAQKSVSIVSRLFGYVGGIFILSGIATLIGMNWDSFGSGARVVITLGTGFVLYLMALAAVSDERYERAATPLFMISALLQPTGILVMLEEYSSGGNPAHGILYMSGIMLAQQAITFYAKRRSSLAFFAIVFGCIFFGTAFDLMEMPDEIIGLIIGTSLLCVSWAASKSEHEHITPFWYLVGSGLLFVSFFDIVENSPIEILFLGLSAFMIYVSTVARSRTLLFTATIAMLSYIGYYTAEYFADQNLIGVGFLVFGLILIGISTLALRINKKYIQA